MTEQKNKTGANSEICMTLTRQISNGPFKVYHANSTDGKKSFAVKFFSKKPEEESIFEKEINIHSILVHKNIIKCYPYETMFQPSTPKFIITKYAPHGTFFDLVQNEGLKKEILIRSYFHQLVEGLEYIHSKNVAHLDLKLENLLLDEDFTLKIADFGLSRKVDVNYRDSTKGTANYRAPEVIENNCKDLFAADIYSLGVILYAMRFGEYPFAEYQDDKGLNALDLSHFVKENSEYWIQKQKNCKINLTETFVLVLNGVLNPDPLQRFTIERIKATEWYNGPILVDIELKNEMERVWDRILYKKSSRNIPSTPLYF